MIKSKNILLCETDVLVVGSGIMGVTLASILKEIEPSIRVDIVEALNAPALESSHAYNNAGTGHAGYCEMNYTPLLPNKKIDIQKDLQTLPVVAEVYYESQAEAFKRFGERFKGSAIAQNVTADQLPESFRIKLKDPTKFAVIESAFAGRPGVDIVQDQRAILEKFFKLLAVLRNGALVIGAASVFTASLLISNTLRIAAFNRRRETGVMKLVGASSFSIQLPFLLEGVFAALSGWAVSTGVLVGFKAVVDSRVAPLLTFTQFFTWKDVWVASAWLLLTGLVVSSVASFITLRKYLKV